MVPILTGLLLLVSTAASPNQAVVPSRVVPAHVAKSLGKIKFYGDPLRCGERLWRWCYFKGNLDLVTDVLAARGVERVRAEAEAFEVLWVLADEADSRDYAAYRKLEAHQWINHFPGVFQLGNKGYLGMNLKRAREVWGPGAYDFFPLSFHLPEEQAAFELHDMSRRAAGEQPVYVLKQDAADRGEGVTLVSSPAQAAIEGGGLVGAAVKAVVQEYLDRPYLINGFKQTLRMYLLVTCYDPLRAYLFAGGFVHIASEKFSSDPASFGRRYMHLTNPDINGEKAWYKKNPRPFYWTIHELYEHIAAEIQERGGSPEAAAAAVEQVQREMLRVVGRLLLATEAKATEYMRRRVPFRGNSFELLGLDLMLTMPAKAAGPFSRNTTGTAHDEDRILVKVVEVNPDPDMTGKKGFRLARVVKSAMLSDMFHLIGITTTTTVDPDNTTEHGGVAAASAAAADVNLGTIQRRAERLQRRVALAEAIFAWFRGGHGSEDNAPPHESFSKCARAAATQPRSTCLVRSMRDALLLADSELEIRRRGRWIRVLPHRRLAHGHGDEAAGGEMDLLSSLEEPRRNQALLECWDRFMASCGYREREQKEWIWPDVAHNVPFEGSAAEQEEAAAATSSS